MIRRKLWWWWENVLFERLFEEFVVGLEVEWWVGIVIIIIVMIIVMIIIIIVIINEINIKIFS